MQNLVKWADIISIPSSTISRKKSRGAAPFSIADSILPFSPILPKGL